MSVGSANDNLVTESRVQIIQPDYISDTAAFQQGGTPGRVPQQRLMPTSIAGRFITPIQTPGQIIMNEADVPSGSSFILTTLTQNPGGNLIDQSVFYQVYVGSVRSPENRMPEAIPSTQFPFYSWKALYNADGVSVLDNPGMVIDKLQVRNNTVFYFHFIVESYVRYIVNAGGSASSD